MCNNMSMDLSKKSSKAFYWKPHCSLASKHILKSSWDPRIQEAETRELKVQGEPSISNNLKTTWDTLSQKSMARDGPHW